MYRTDFWTLWEKVRVGCSERIALKPVYYQVWNRLPVQVVCMRQVLRAGTLGWPRGMGWGWRWEGGSGWGTHVNTWLIHVSVWQNPLQYCKVISLQLIKINEKKTSMGFVFRINETANTLYILFTCTFYKTLTLLHTKVRKSGFESSTSSLTYWMIFEQVVTTPSTPLNEETVIRSRVSKLFL